MVSCNEAEIHSFQTLKQDNQMELSTVDADVMADQALLDSLLWDDAADLPAAGTDGVAQDGGGESDDQEESLTCNAVKQQQKEDPEAIALDLGQAEPMMGVVLDEGSGDSFSVLSIEKKSGGGGGSDGGGGGGGEVTIETSGIKIVDKDVAFKISKELLVRWNADVEAAQLQTEEDEVDTNKCTSTNAPTAPMLCQ